MLENIAWRSSALLFRTSFVVLVTSEDSSFLTLFIEIAISTKLNIALALITKNPATYNQIAVSTQYTFETN